MKKHEKMFARLEEAETLLIEFIACCEVDDPNLRWGDLKARVFSFLEGDAQLEFEMED